VIVLGLTGSIGMGKSTAAGMLRRLGVPLFDADAAVHRLLGPGGDAVAAVEQAFPGVRDDTGAIDRHRLGMRVFGDPAALRRLEAILHPMVRQAETRFVRRAEARRERLVVLDIPLLYETGAPERCDYVLVVSAPARVQRERVMRRPGMTDSRLASILRAQMPDREKRRRADFVVPTGLGRGLTFRRLRQVVAELRHRQTDCRAEGMFVVGRSARGRLCGKS
jgi:dephospho-CoA kinase